MQPNYRQGKNGYLMTLPVPISKVPLLLMVGMECHLWSMGENDSTGTRQGPLPIAKQCAVLRAGTVSPVVSCCLPPLAQGWSRGQG